MKTEKITRRTFVGTLAAAGAGVVLTPPSFGFPAILKNLGKPDSKINGVQVGCITYSFRSMNTDAESVLKYCVDAGISAIELMGSTAEAFAGAPHTSTEPMAPFRPGQQRPQLTPEQQAERDQHTKDIQAWRAGVAMDKFQQLRKMYKEAGVSIYAFKPNAFGVNNSDAEVNYGMQAARALGAWHVTLEMPTQAAQTKRLSELGAANGIFVAYHGHEQQTPKLWDAALKESKFNMLNCDLGHYTAAGFDAVELVDTKKDRIASAHIKDRQNLKNGKANLPWGTGNTPIVEVLQLMKKRKLKFPATIELEYEIPEGSDAVKEVAKCLEYCRKALDSNS